MARSSRCNIVGLDRAVELLPIGCCPTFCEPERRSNSSPTTKTTNPTRSTSEITEYKSRRKKRTSVFIRRETPRDLPTPPVGRPHGLMRVGGGYGARWKKAWARRQPPRHLP